MHNIRKQIAQLVLPVLQRDEGRLVLDYLLEVELHLGPPLLLDGAAESLVSHHVHAVELPIDQGPSRS